MIQFKDTLLPRQAHLKLEFLIIGAGVAGLATAFSLAKCGHTVHVVDRYSCLENYPAVGGVRLPTNASKILIEWGFADEINQYAFSVKGSTMMSLDAGEVIGYVNWQAAVVKYCGGPSLLMHHADLHRMLYNRCIASGVQIDFDIAVTKVKSESGNAGRPYAVIADNSMLEADIIIGADGPGSTVRRAVCESVDEVTRGKTSVFIGFVSSNALSEDKQLCELMESCKSGMDLMVFMGEDRRMISFPAGKAGYSVHLHLPDHEMQQITEDVEEEKWDHTFPPSIISPESYCILAQKLIKLVPAWVCTPRMRQKMENIVDTTTRIALVGEAAHTLLPTGIFTTSMSIEDAAIFGTLFAHLHSWDQVPWIMEAYEELGMERAADSERSETMIHGIQYQKGREQQARGKYFRKQRAVTRDPTKASKDDERLELFESIAEVFGYHAIEAAEGWWANWGVLRERAKNRTTHESIQFKMDVTSTIVTR